MSRTTIRVPGFTAEASLFTSMDNYRSEGRFTYIPIEKMVIPQMEACICCRECMELGGTPGSCAPGCHHKQRSPKCESVKTLQAKELVMHRVC